MKKSNLVTIGLVCLIGVALFSNPVLAEEAAAAAKPEAQSGAGVFKAIKDGGIWMAPIILCFFIGLAIAFERLFVVMGKRMPSTNFMTMVISSISADKIDEAVTQCQTYEDKTLAKVIQTGLVKSIVRCRIQSALDACSC